MAYINKDVSTMAMPSGMNRMGQFPLDMSSVFYTEAELRTYATSSAIAYVGQIISLVDATNNKVTVYSIQDTAGNLKEVGTVPLGDGSTIEVSAAGVVSLLGAATAEAGKLPMLEMVKVVDAEGEPVMDEETGLQKEEKRLVWKSLEQIGAGDGNDNTTYAFSWSADTQKLTIVPSFNGVAEAGQEIDLSAFINATELATELAPYAKSADVVASSAFETFKTENTEAIAAAKSGAEKTASDALAAARTEITKEIDDAGKVLQANIDKKVDIETYNTDKKALEDEDDAIRAIAEGVRDAFNTFMTSEDIDETVNTLKEVQAEIAKMTDATELELALASKADKTYAEGLEDRIEVLEGKPFDTYATKSEVEAVDGKFANYTTTATLETLLAGKQDNLTAGTDYATPAQVETAKGEAIEAAASDATSKANTAKSEAIADAAGKYYGKGETYTKSEIDELLEGIQGGASESAASVNTKLEAYKKVVNAEVWGDEAGTGVDGNSRIDILDQKVKALEDVGSQANVIESVVGATDNRLSVSTSGKTVTIDDANLRSDIAAAKKAGDDAAAAASTAQTAANNAQNAADVADGKAVKNAEDIKALQEADTTANGKIQALETTVNNEVSGVAANYAAVVKNAGDITALSATVGTHTTDIADLKTAISNNGTAITNLQTAVANVYTKTEADGKFVAQESGKSLISTTEIERLATLKNYDDTAVKALIQGNTDAITEITKEGGAIATAVAAEAAIARAAEKKNADDIVAINALLNTVSDEDGINTLKELATWVEEHGSEASEMAEAISDNAEAIAAINNAETGILALAKAHSDANLATAKKYTDDSIAALLVKNVDNKTLQLDENGVASVKAVSTDLLVQGDSELVLSAGNATGYTTV